VQKLSDRFDPITFEAQILVTLGQCTSLAEKHNRELVTYFLSLAGPDAPSRLQRFKLRAWSKLFSKFSNPRALHATDTPARNVPLSHPYPDRELQVASLSYLLAYKLPHLWHHGVKETKWRDELTSLHMTSIESKDRYQLVDVVVRLLYGLMLEEKGRLRGGDRRTAVLTALARCADQEPSFLVDLMLNPMESGSAARQDSLFLLYQVSSNVSFKQQSGYLTLLGDVLKNLRSRLTRVLGGLATLDLLRSFCRV
jgi:U3 small nucleolar RNA-associated protein 20